MRSEESPVGRAALMNTHAVHLQPFLPTCDFLSPLNSFDKTNENYLASFSVQDAARMLTPPQRLNTGACVHGSVFGRVSTRLIIDLHCNWKRLMNELHTSIRHCSVLSGGLLFCWRSEVRGRPQLIASHRGSGSLSMSSLSGTQHQSLSTSCCSEWWLPATPIGQSVMLMIFFR